MTIFLTYNKHGELTFGYMEFAGGCISLVQMHAHARFKKVDLAQQSIPKAIQVFKV